jgi:hypothetical protein
VQVQELADRRNRQRFSLRLAVRCRGIETRSLFGRTVTGESLNISSTGLLFTTCEAFQPGQLLEASIDWPMLLDDRVGLTLVVEGAVVRRADELTAMRIDRYQFKTRSAA